VTYAAVVFDLLTALLDSWTLWNDVAGSPDAGMKWRRRYLEITYGCGAYRPYETLVREAARDVGLPESLGDGLERRWDELAPWPEARRVLARLSVPLAVATNCSIRLGRQAADRVGVPFKTVATAESVGFYKPRPEPYRAVLAALGTAPDRTLFVAGSAPPTCRAPRAWACRSIGTIASGFRHATTPGPTISNRRSTGWPICFLRPRGRAMVLPQRGESAWRRPVNSSPKSTASDRPTGSRT
jgi:2-haloacid dehalogenase